MLSVTEINRTIKEARIFKASAEVRAILTEIILLKAELILARNRGFITAGELEYSTQTIDLIASILPKAGTMPSVMQCRLIGNIKEMLKVIDDGGSAIILKK